LKIVEAAIEVHKQLGPGYAENLYEEALKIELRQRGIGLINKRKSRSNTIIKPSACMFWIWSLKIGSFWN
jgi:GxxExxY protein